MFPLCLTFAEGPRQDVLEGSCLQKVTHFLQGEGLLYQQAEEQSVAQLPEVVEEVSPGIWVLHDVIQLSVVVSQHTCGPQNR